MLQIGSIIDGKYKILDQVGKGGMCTVYLAMNEKANKQWAVKEVRKDGEVNFEAVKQSLVAEIDILKRLNHPNLPSIVDVIDTDECFLIIMDYIQGKALNFALNDFGAQPQENVIEWAMQLCDVLDYLHTLTPPIIYRDMKPSNIMLKPDGNITLIDFGTAREYKEKNLADTTCLGTVGYAAPEQFGGMGQTDARTDIYCLGATLYHLVTGKNPCEPPYEIKPIREINPALSGGLERIILKATQRDPNDRYQSAAEMIYALEHYEEIDDVYRKKQKKKLNKFLTSILLTIVFTFISIFGYISAEKQREKNYDYILSNAHTVDDYYDAIITNTTKVDAYLGSEDYDGLIKFLISDGNLTAEENTYLLKLKGGLDKVSYSGYTSNIDVLDELRNSNPHGYSDVCYEIGEAYLFYYNVAVEKDKYLSAASWFQYAKEDYPIAKVYCDISTCLENIYKYSKAEQYAKLYSEYESLWDKIISLSEDVEAYDDDLKLQVWNEIVNMINNNAKEFSEVSSNSQIISTLDNILKKSKKIKNTFLQGNVENLQDNILIALNKLNSIKTDID